MSSPRRRAARVRRETAAWTARLRNTCRLTALLIAVVALPGCRTSASGWPILAESAPLSDEQFERFTAQVADRVRGVVERSELAKPVSITPPETDPGPLSDPEQATAFSRNLTAALNDRLVGTARFSQPVIGTPPLESYVQFAGDDHTPTRQTVSFVLADRDSGREMLRGTMPFETRPSAQPEHAAFWGGPQHRIALDPRTNDFARYLAKRVRYYGGQSVTGRHGRLLFLDETTWKRVGLQAARVGRTPDQRLRIEFDLKTYDRDRDVLLRGVFVDRLGRQVEVTPIMPYKLLRDHLKTVVFTASVPDAAQYYVLVKTRVPF